MKKVLVTGGAGFIGSHCVVSLFENGYEPIIVDNFSNSKKAIIKSLKRITKKNIEFHNLDLRNRSQLIKLFKKHKFHSVIHCAGLKIISESIEQPLVYLENNIGSTLSLLECMNKSKVFNLVFSSSASVYDHLKFPLTEKSKIGKIDNSYGTSKYIIEKILIDLAKFNRNWSIRIARYFNPIGNHSSGLLKDNPKKNKNGSLFFFINQVVKKKQKYLKIYGKNHPTKDGTCVRDYIHVMDLAEGHTLMIKKNYLEKGLKIYNFGTGKGYTVLEVVKTFEKQTNIKIPYRFTKKRKGDVPVSFCSPKKIIKELKWRAKFDLSQAIKDINK